MNLAWHSVVTHTERHRANANQGREPVPMVRCRLDPRHDEGTPESLRYVPLAEFHLWRHLMETRHARRVTIEQVSVWLPEDPELWNSGFLPDELEPVLRLRLNWPGPYGVPTPVVRYFPAETYPQAQEALLSHLPGAPAHGVEACAGYFVPEQAWQARRERHSAVA
jgi:hypothetical protein